MLAVSALVAGGVSLYLTLRPSSSTEPAAAPKNQLGVTFGPGSLALSGSF